jgi:hypothetical protein
MIKVANELNTSLGKRGSEVTHAGKVMRLGGPHGTTKPRSIRRGDWVTSQPCGLNRRAVAIAEKTDDLNMQADTLVALGEVLRAAGRIDDATVAFTRAFQRYRAKGNIILAEDVLQRKSALSAAV